MSRTFRRVNEKQEYDWVLRDWRHSWFTGLEFRLDPKSKEGKEAIARYHSDKYRNFKEPGPAWYRNMFTERPQRRKAKNQLRKFMLDEEFEVMLNGKDPLEYWT